MAVNKFTLTLDGQSYEIERRQDLIVVNGMECPFAPGKEGQILISGQPHAVKLSGGTVEVDGIGYTFEATGLEEPKPSTSRRKAASEGAAAEAGAVLAVMPGLIIKVLKQEGDRVKAGETILILEAMKMQNEIQAKAAGVIRQMNVKQGENVEIRQVLCVVE